MDEKLLHELSRLGERVAVLETKQDSQTELLREILTQAKLTNGRVYRLESEASALHARADSNSSGIAELKRAERGVLVAGWKVSIYIITGAGAFAAVAMKAIEALAK
ncbi:MAG: hypothetical protein IPK72_21100 [Candidatus Eisenbacteria bacterium]|nr:hypothetical protein [Candidatus Eisenbacteria bacterium]